MTDPHPPSDGHPTDRLLGASPAIASLRAQIRHLANFDAVGSSHVPTILLQGETGTGKGLVARVIHDSGPRASGPFIEVNCAAIPDTMLEAELFGFEPGAFTDAKRTKPGLFEAASGGTLFLDEIDALPLALQGKLLTVIETKRVRRLGAVTERVVDVKCIAASNAVLPEVIATGCFRADLYHRLAVVVLGLPPLRARGEDVVALAEAFLHHYTTAHGVPSKRLSTTAQAWLREYAWPGNVRELMHVLERVALLHRGEEVDAETVMQLCPPLMGPAVSTDTAPAPHEVAGEHALPAEAEQIRQALAQTGGNVARAARLLGVSRDTVRYRMQRYGITRLRPAAPPMPEVAASAPPDALQMPTREPPADLIRVCPRCQLANPAEVPECTACAASLAVQSLPAVPPPDVLAAPPSSDGTPLSVARPLPEAERRYLTVLFSDLVDSASLAVQLDPEDFPEVVRAYHQTCTEVIHRFGGYVDQYLGDGILACFGYPMAHEDDAQRAVRAGLEMLDAVQALNTQLTLPSGERLAVRLGVHTGLVVVGAAGEGGRQEPLAPGETLYIADRLQHLAAPHTLVVSAATYQLIEGYFMCEALGAQPLRGLGEPLRVYRVLRPSGLQSRLEVAAARGLTPLVGREAEVGLLVERWARVTAGMGQVVVLQGEAGIGKSRLVQVLKDHVAREAHTCLECRGSPYSQHTAWYPIAELLQRWLQWRPGEAPGEMLGKLEALLAQVHLPLDETVPLLAALMALPLPAEHYAARPLPPEQQRRQTFEVLLALVGGLAEQQPVLWIVEDLHWVDPSTLELLELALDQVPTARIYTVLTCRPGFQPRWGFRTHLTSLVLNRLTPSQVEAMVEGMLGPQRLSAAMLEQIVAQTDGIPLFVEEVTKAVLEAGLGAGVAGQDAATGALRPVAIPATLHEALMARLDRLGSAKAVAQLGAILGRQFSYPLLRAVTTLEEESLQGDLAALVAAELLYQRGQPPRAVYTFKHALVQEAAYESVLQRVRRQTHQRLVEVLKAQFPETVATQPELLAYHALRGEVWDQAVAALRQAGEQAVARSASREAVAAFEQALEALQHCPDRRDTRAQAIDLRLALRIALRPLGDLGRILAVLREAEALAEAVDDSDRLGQISVFLTQYFITMGAYDQASATARRALALAIASGDVVLSALANFRLGNAYRAQGDYRRAINCLRQTVASLEGTRRHERFGQVTLPAVHARASLAACHAELGTFAEGCTLGEEGVRIAEAVAHPSSLMWASWGLGVLALRQGDLARALPQLERAVGICHQGNLPVYFPRLAATLGAAYTLAGRIADAVRLLTQALDRSPASERLYAKSLCSIPLGQAHLLAGRLAEAYTLAEQALAHACAHQERGHQAYALHLLGDIAAHREPLQRDQAEAFYRAALALADELGMRPLVAHCHLGLGTLYDQMGRSEDARAALSTAIRLYRAMEMVFWLPQAEATLAKTGEEPKHPQPV